MKSKQNNLANLCILPKLFQLVSLSLFLLSGGQEVVCTDCGSRSAFSTSNRRKKVHPRRNLTLIKQENREGTTAKEHLNEMRAAVMAGAEGSQVR